MIFQYLWSALKSYASNNITYAERDLLYTQEGKIAAKLRPWIERVGGGVVNMGEVGGKKGKRR